MGDFAVETAVTGDDGRHRAVLSEDWEIWGPMGGYVAAIALRAAGLATDFPRPASFACHYLGVARFDEVDLEVTSLRRAKRAESLRVSMTQGGRPILEAVVWCVDELDGLTHADGDGPRVPGPDELKPIQELLTPEQLEQGPPYSFWNNFDERPVTWEADWENREASDPVWQAWLRFIPTPTFDDPFVDAGRLLVLLDVCQWPAASRGYAASELTHIAPSLDLSAVFHHLEPDEEWLLADGHSPVARDGLVGGRASVWTPSGTLLASGCQQMLCRPMPG